MRDLTQPSPTRRGKIFGMDEKLKQSILKTLAYFDVFGYPLTKEEIWKYLVYYGYPDNTDLWITYTDFVCQLQQLEQLHQFQHKDGFYFLSGREENVAIRQRAVKWFEQKMKIAKRAVKKIRWAPFLRAVFVCNTLAGPGLKEESDIDVFIITRRGRIWLVRFLATLVLKFFRLRTFKNKTKDKVCLSFYVTDDNLNLSKIAIDEDVYLMYWLAQLIPIYDPDNLRSSIQRANQWVKKYLPNAFVPFELSERLRVGNRKISKFVKNLLEKIWGGGYGDLMERQAREAQKARIKMSYKGAGVIVNDSMLKFHENDRRAEYRQRWLEKISNSPNF